MILQKAASRSIITMSGGRSWWTGEEHFAKVCGDTFIRLWTLKRAVKEHFLI